MIDMINFADGIATPLELQILESEEVADMIIKDFKNMYSIYIYPNPEILLTKLADNYPNVLLPESITRIENEVSNFLSMRRRYEIY